MTILAALVVLLLTACVLLIVDRAYWKELAKIEREDRDWWREHARKTLNELWMDRDRLASLEKSDSSGPSQDGGKA